MRAAGATGGDGQRRGLARRDRLRFRLRGDCRRRRGGARRRCGGRRRSRRARASGGVRSAGRHRRGKREDDRHAPQAWPDRSGVCSPQEASFDDARSDTSGTCLAELPDKVTAAPRGASECTSYAMCERGLTRRSAAIRLRDPSFRLAPTRLVVWLPASSVRARRG